MRKKAPKPQWQRLLSGLLYTCILLFAVVAGTLMGFVGQSTVLTKMIVFKAKNTPPQEVFHQDTMNILLLGCDEDRAYGGKKILKTQARSDMMLVARLDFKKNRITGVSIPRDTLAELPGYRATKINAFHVFGGKELSQQAVEALLDIKIDRTIVVDYKAFQEMVDMVGGVDIFVPKKLKYTDRRGGLFIDLKPGRQKLNGYNAMCFVRYRHGDSDFERQNRQKDFLLAFKDSVTKSPTTLPAISTKAMAVLGGEMNADELAMLAVFAGKIGSDNVKMAQIPVLDAGNYNLKVDRPALRKQLQEYHFFDAEPTAVSYN